MPEYWYTGDLHLGHSNILKFEPARGELWEDVREMDEGLIENWNAVVKGGDVVVHVGDLTFHHKPDFVNEKFIKYLKGNKIFVKGNHDYWFKGGRHIYHHTVNNQFIAASHYPMRSWNRSIHGSWNLHGHTHGHLDPVQNQLDVGVDNVYNLVGIHRPLSFEEVKYFIEKEGSGEYCP